MLFEITNQPIFGVTITIITYLFGVWLNNRFKSIFTTPLLVSTVLIISFLLVFKIPLENYKSGAVFIEMLIPPATTALALSIWKNVNLIKKNLLPIIVGCIVGAITSILCVIVLCKLFNIDEKIFLSLLPKSVTTAIAIQLTEEVGGIIPITSVAVFITGVFIGVTSPFLIKVLRIKNKVAAGIAMGTAGHAFATAKAIEIGEVEGALSGIAIGICGLATVFFMIFV